MTDTETPAKPGRTVVSKELGEFLVELSIGVHRFAMYPPDHPSLSPAVESITTRLAKLFETRHMLSIGVAQRQLVIEGITTEQKHALLADLARRLHGHQIGALTFEKGVTPTQVEGVLKALATESERGGTPLGMLPQDQMPRWEFASLHRVGYERLELLDKDGDGVGNMDRGNALWLGLARAALATDDDLAVAPDASSLARVIKEHKAEEAYDQVIVGYLLQLAEELKTPGPESESVRDRVSTLISELDEDTLTRLVEFGGDPAQQRRFLVDANQSLAVESVVKVLGAAARTREQDISHSMTRLLTKLAVHARQGRGEVRSQADTALRDNVEALIAGWDLKDPNPDAYTNVLDAMSRAAPVLHGEDGGADALTGAQRLLEMALEVDAYGPIVAKALSDVVATRGAGTVLAHLKLVEPTNCVAGRIRAYLTSPDRFRALLVDQHMDDETLSALVSEMGPDAADPLLDVLCESESGPVRRRVMEALVGMGPPVGELVLERLDDTRAGVVRTLLSLLQRLDHFPEGFDPVPLTEHEDPLVRREAVLLALQDAESRERVLVTALADPDEDVVQIAIDAMRDGVPDSVLPTLVNRVVRSKERPVGLRTEGVKALGRSVAPLALATLIDLSTAGRTFFGRVKLASNLEGLTALRTLATDWADSAEAKRVLQLAHRSKDTRIRGAAYVTSASRRADPGDTP